MPFRQLPTELVSAIFNYLAAEEDHLSLRTCSLTCKAFATPAQTRLLHTVFIVSEARAAVLSRNLESIPYVGRFVKCLNFLETDQPWIELSDALPKLLGLLTPYTLSLKIYQRRDKVESPRFDFSSLSQLERLQEISLHEERPSDALASAACGDNALPTFLNHFPKLRTIILDECLVKNQAIGIGDSVAIKAAASVFQLNRLGVHRCDDALVLEWVITALSSLRKLCVSYSGPNATPQNAGFPKFVAAAGESLQYLEARGFYHATDEEMQLLMNAVQKHATNLRSLKLKLSGSPIDISEKQRSPIQVVVQSLLLIDTHSHLQHLTIEISPCELHARNGPWDDFEDLLLGQHFSALRIVEICLLKSEGFGTLVSADSIIALVPRLAERKVVFLSTMLEHNY